MRVLLRGGSRALRTAAAAAFGLLVLASPAAAAPGDLDTTFSDDGIQTTGFSGGEASDVAVTQGGKVVVVGFANNNPDDFAVARFNTNGDLDTTFDADGKATTDFGGDEYAWGVAIAPDGKIVAFGETSTGDGDFALARYNDDGSLDTTFGGDGKVTTDFGGADAGYWHGVAIAPNGRIAAGGVTFDGSDFHFALARYNDDGSLDTTFGGDGKVSTDFLGAAFLYGLAIAPDGKIVAAGEASSQFAVARYNTDGSLDTSFDGDGKQTTDFGRNQNVANDVVVDSDGKVTAIGYANPDSDSDNDFAAARYNADGSLDTSFDDDGKATAGFGGSSELAYGAALSPDGKLVLGGQVQPSGNNDFGLVRFDPDGSLDTGFDGDGLVSTPISAGGSDGVNGIALAPDGKILAAGVGATADRFTVARYEGDPIVLDTAINSGPMNGSTVTSSTASFGFSSTSPGVIGFECSLDGGPFEACVSPKQLSGLGDGAHTFAVRAVNSIQSRDATPAQRSFTVDTSEPPPSDPPAVSDEQDGGGPSGSTDSEPPTADLSGKKKQKVGKAVSVKVSCDEDCEVLASGTLMTKKSKSKPSRRAALKLKPASASLAAGETTTLKLKLPKKARKAAARMLRNGGKVKAKLTLMVSDSAENTTTAKRTVNLKQKR